MNNNDYKVPDYSGACVNNIVPALLQYKEIGEGWIPEDILESRQVVLLVIDGLGYEQFIRHKHLFPCLSKFTTNDISTVFPTTTATALTSITTGRSPGEHGMVGYKVRVAGQTLNALRWTTESGPAHLDIDPADFQPIVPFLGSKPTVVSPAMFAESGFTAAHLRLSNYVGYWLPSSIGVEIGHAVRNGEPFVYAYYDGLDKIGHIKGFGDHYEAELRVIDDLVKSITDTLPPGVALIVTADHGMVQVGENLIPISKEVRNLTTSVSGEARFVWLHAENGYAEDLFFAAKEAHGDVAWVLPVEQILEEGWFGHDVTDSAKSRLGDVALVVHDSAALVLPEKPGPSLVARHGSITDEEARVPLLTLKLS